MSGAIPLLSRNVIMVWTGTALRCLMSIPAGCNESETVRTLECILCRLTTATGCLQRTIDMPDGLQVDCDGIPVLWLPRIRDLT